MWRGASEAKVAATRDYGAAVDLEATDPRGAFERLDVLLAETGRTLVHPFDDPFDDRGAGNGRAGDSRGFSRASRRSSFRSVAGARRGRRARRCGPRPRLGVEPEGLDGAALRARRGRARRGVADVDRGRPERAARGRARADDRPGARRGGRPRDRGGDRGRVPLPLRARQARLRAGRRSGRRAPCSPGRSRAGRIVCIVSGGNVAAPRPPLVSWPADESRHPSRLRPRARDLLVRERVLDALDEGRAPRRDLRRVPSVLHGEAEARRHRRSGGALPAPAREIRRRAAVSDE